MLAKCGIHNANRQALDLADPKILAAGMLTFVIEPKRKGRIAAPLSQPSKVCGCYAVSVLALPVAVPVLSASLPRMKERRSGLITNSAVNAAVAFSATATTNTAFQP